ncbi:hypothetical protein AMTR_s00080p00161090 [Amborella trichopoda]|uniref:Uncharacterized protein n=1 Tax=Amborella trichopoda TaxID=13333 RepID=W1PD37_AMBTC|nr:hypothetical protein AMTR_s00080p00161090 [Amborella trichopoda]
MVNDVVSKEKVKDDLNVVSHCKMPKLMPESISKIAENLKLTKKWVPIGRFPEWTEGFSSYALPQPDRHSRDFSTFHVDSLNANLHEVSDHACPSSQPGGASVHVAFTQSPKVYLHDDLPLESNREIFAVDCMQLHFFHTKKPYFWKSMKKRVFEVIDPLRTIPHLEVSPFLLLGGPHEAAKLGVIVSELMAVDPEESKIAAMAFDMGMDLNVPIGVFFNEMKQIKKARMTVESGAEVARNCEGRSEKTPIKVG